MRREGADRRLHSLRQYALVHDQIHSRLVHGPHDGYLLPGRGCTEYRDDVVDLWVDRDNQPGYPGVGVFQLQEIKRLPVPRG